MGSLDGSSQWQIADRQLIGRWWGGVGAGLALGVNHEWVLTLERLPQLLEEGVGVLDVRAFQLLPLYAVYDLGGVLLEVPLTGLK